MNNGTSRLLPFEANGERYVFSGYTGLLVRSNAELEAAIQDDCVGALGDDAEYLLGTSDTQRPAAPPMERTPLDNITIFTTNQCNLNCSYCYERANGALDGAKMSFETFQAGIDFFLSRFQTNKRINLLFFGGEPLLNAELMKRAVRYAGEIRKQRGIQFTHSVTTNGTVMTPETLDFLIANEFSIVVSIDSSKEAHDSNRPFLNGRGSHAAVLRTVRRASPYVRVAARVTLTDLDTDFVKLYEELNAEGFWSVHVTIVAQPWNERARQEGPRLIAERMKEMERHFLRNVSDRRVVRFSDLLKYLKLIHKGWRSNGYEKRFPCMAGYSSFSLAVNGDIFLCHRFNNVAGAKFGNIRDGISADQRERFLTSHLVYERQGACKTCWGADVCGGTCYHAAFASGKDTRVTDELHCTYLKAMLQSALNIYVSLTPEQRLFLEHLD